MKEGSFVSDSDLDVDVDIFGIRCCIDNNPSYNSKELKIKNPLQYLND